MSNHFICLKEAESSIIFEAKIRYMRDSVSLFRKVALAEGISFLLLLFVAEPLKHFAGMPEAVKYTGWLHGLLFVLYVATLIMAAMEEKWKFGKVAILFVASLIPFAPFVVDKKLKDKK
ncbi:DUF3817 domain-containing protein [Pedobacter sp. MW01-1-1]|uniref:DUF3817 domain-containing protein n=1 Tax=Pedobacter sp. MW01-1-1 TaxID=3383027 RepID=UPI003FEE6D02